ncbi:MAG: Gfo/Idh/MocA family oxidoreductase [Planctomycetes bacterium]|nr:Gfo/Idh/MocA family oxidoreductase [Planctomycetota bacterium]
MKIWNFGIVGAGLIADFHSKAIAELPNARLVGVCDKEPLRAREMGEKYSCQVFGDYQELVQADDVDVVSIATPSGFHLEPSVAAAWAHKHVICEKPLEISLERADAMIEAHRDAGTQLGCVFQNRFNDAMGPLREAIEEGRFGVVTYAGVYVPWWREEDYYRDSWHGTWELDGGGALMNQSIHMVDMLCDLLEPVAAVQAFTGRLGHRDMETEDTALAVLRFEGGALGVIYGTTASYPGGLKRFEISGTKGTVVFLEDSFVVWQFQEERASDEEIRRQFGEVKGLGGSADPAAITHENHRRNFRAFLEALDGEWNFEIGGQEARKSVALIRAIYESAETQKLVEL